MFEDTRNDRHSDVEGKCGLCGPITFCASCDKQKVHYIRATGERFCALGCIKSREMPEDEHGRRPVRLPRVRAAS